MTMLPPHPAFDTATVRTVMAASRQVADMLCDRWTLLILLSAHAGKSRFSEFRDRWHIPSRMLTSRLNFLEEKGLLIRMAYSRRPLRHSYHLTPMGTALFDVLAAMLTSELESGDKASAEALHLHHLSCGCPAVRPVTCCAACGGSLHASNVTISGNATGLQEEQPQWANSYRRSRPRETTAPSAAPAPLTNVLDIYGNKWSNEIIRCGFLRITAFSDMQRVTGIASNILADRLSRLVQAGVLRQEMSELDGRRIAYKLTTQGVKLFPIVLAMWDWADHWIEDRVLAPFRLHHDDCGRPVRVVSRCNHCSKEIRPADARFVLPAA